MVPARALLSSRQARSTHVWRQPSFVGRPVTAYGRGVGLRRHRHSNQRSKLVGQCPHFPRVPHREFHLLQLLQARRGSGPTPTELDNTDIDYNNIQNNMSDSRRSPTSTPRSGGNGPATRSTTRGARATQLRWGRGRPPTVCLWVPSIGACRSIYDCKCSPRKGNTVCDILEPPTHALPTTWRHTAKWGGGPRPAGRASPVEGQPLRRGTLHACYWNSLLGALTQALIPTAAHADTSLLKSDSAEGR